MITYFQEHIGEGASLLTALLWTITALAFESASLKVGSLPVNIIRMFMGFFFISIFLWIYKGQFIPLDASKHNWIWLSVSGLIGFVFGDLFLFRSFTIIGSRFAMLIMTLVPPLTALLGWFILKEKLLLFQVIGMVLTFLGITLAVFNHQNGLKKFTLKLSPKGVLFAFGGALGQAGGLIAGKYGMGEYDPFAATQIRIIAGCIGFLILLMINGKVNLVISAVKNTVAMKRTMVGAFFGLFLGVSLAQVAIQHTETGIASTIMSLVPILIIPPTLIIYKQKITFWEVVGAFVSVIGVTLFFIH